MTLPITSLMVLNAQTMRAADVLILTDKDGAKTTFVLEDKPVVSFNDEDVTVSTEKGVISLSAHDFCSFSFDEQTTDVEERETTNPTFTFSDGLQCHGLQQGTAVSVFKADGQLVAEGTTDSSGDISLRFGTVRGTVYIVKTATKTFKFTK